MSINSIFDEANKVLIERMFNFEKFGHEDKAASCKKCGKKPARVEPRFGYASCIDHFHLKPTDFN